MSNSILSNCMIKTASFWTPRVNENLNQITKPFTFLDHEPESLLEMPPYSLVPSERGNDMDVYSRDR